MAKKSFEIGVWLPMWRGNTKCYTRNHLTPWHEFVIIQLHLPRDLLSIQPRIYIFTARFPIFIFFIFLSSPDFPSNTKQRACQQTQSSRPMECIACTW